MLDPLSSPARLTDAETVETFKALFLSHGALGPGGQEPARWTEEERMRVVPLVFGLLPLRAVAADDVYLHVKPLIRTRLSELGIAEDGELVDILKVIADQYRASEPGRRTFRRKATIADLRVRQPLYREMRMRQNARCAVCGAHFSETEENLDHRIPWRLLGDPQGGLNWQILCRWCNSGKREWLSCLQSAEAWGWIYRTVRIVNRRYISPESRYIVLAQRRGCQFEGCSAGPMESRLVVGRHSESALPVADNLVVRCQNHVDDIDPEDDPAWRDEHGLASSEMLAV
jgi:hypothetical protein